MVFRQAGQDAGSERGPADAEDPAAGRDGQADDGGSDYA